MSGLHDEPQAVTVTDSRIVYAGAVWDVRSDTFDYNGHPTVRQYVEHPGAAAVVALDDDRRMLIIQQYRHAISQRDWEIPAGLLDVPGEPPIEAAKRELAEETDLEARDWRSLIAIRTTPGGNDETVHIFLARGLSATETTFEREAEEADMRTEWVALDDVVTAVMDGRFANGILVAGALATAELLRRESAD